MSNQIKTDPAKKLDALSWFRVLLLDELVYNNGKILDSNLIGEITSNVIEKMSERV